MVKKLKQVTRKRAEARADKAMSDYVRERDNWTCVTCGRRGDKHTIQNGHWIPRGYAVYKYDERNGHAQDTYCNKYLSGNWPRYYDFMVATYGKDTVEAMIAGRFLTIKRTAADLLEIEATYKEKLRVLRVMRGGTGAAKS
jgi:hypothetical protein